VKSWRVLFLADKKNKNLNALQKTIRTASGMQALELASA
jgi:hypothetical protein